MPRTRPQAPTADCLRRLVLGAQELALEPDRALGAAKPVGLGGLDRLIKAQDQGNTLDFVSLAGHVVDFRSCWSWEI